jgi:hypothetical protein
MAGNQALQQFLQALFQAVTTAIMLFLSGSLAASEILHPFTHNPDGSHKTAPVQNTTRREDRGDAKVEIQQVEDDDSGNATGNHPAGDPTGLVPCESLGVACANRVPSGFCHFRRHLCIVAPHPDRQCVPVAAPLANGPLDGGHGENAGRQCVPLLAEGHQAEILQELRSQRDFFDQLVSGQQKILVQLPLLAAGGGANGNQAAEAPGVKFESAGEHSTLNIQHLTSKGVAWEPRADNEFCRAGSHWDVTFDGGRTFHLRHTLGVEYLDYLLHRPGRPVSAFDLEIAIRPDKAMARAKDSIQTHLDADAVRDYLRQLDRLRARRDEATGDGDLAAADRLDDDITAIEQELVKNGQAPDTGERSRGNVRKAVVAVQRKLLKGDPNEQNFGRHLEQFLSLGYECCYNQPKGYRWA